MVRASCWVKKLYIFLSFKAKFINVNNRVFHYNVHLIWLEVPVYLTTFRINFSRLFLNVLDLFGSKSQQTVLSTSIFHWMRLLRTYIASVYYHLTPIALKGPFMVLLKKKRYWMIQNWFQFDSILTVFVICSDIILVFQVVESTRTYWNAFILYFWFLYKIKR